MSFLVEARDLISDPSRWCTDAFARDADGQRVQSSDDRACQWCALGAIRKIMVGHGGAEFHYTESFQYLERACRSLGFWSVPDANDHGSHEVVMRLFDKAIELEAADAL